MRAIRIQQFGGPEVMELAELPDPEPAEGEVVVDVARAGVNFADTHATRNDYLAEQTLPLVPGAEVSGTTPDGRRVAAILASGGYASKVAVPERWLVPIPDAVSDDQAAALLLQGLTAHALVHRCARLRPGETVVIQAAGGGTGTLAVQLAKRAGARVVALASTPEKRELAERLGADAAVDSRAEQLGEAILAANDGRAGRRSARDDRRAHLRGLPAHARPVRPTRRLRDRLARAERGLDRPPAAPLALAGRVLAHAPGPAPRARSRR